MVATVGEQLADQQPGEQRPRRRHPAAERALATSPCTYTGTSSGHPTHGTGLEPYSSRNRSKNFTAIASTGTTYTPDTSGIGLSAVAPLQQWQDCDKPSTNPPSPLDLQGFGLGVLAQGCDLTITNLVADRFRHDTVAVLLRLPWITTLLRQA